MIHSLQIEKTMTKTVVVKRKAKRAGIGVNRCEYLRNEHHFPVAVRNVLTEGVFCTSGMSRAAAKKRTN